MYTKDGLAYGGFLDEEDRTFVNWKDPLREVSRSRTNFKDKMEDTCTTAELGCVSAYVEGNYDDENVGSSEMEVVDRRRSLNGDERSELVGGWMDLESHGKGVMRYVCGQSADVPELMSVLEASRGRKRKMEEEEHVEEGITGFTEKDVRVVSGIIRDDDYRHSRKRVKIVDVDYHAETAQSPEPLKLAEHSSKIISLDSNNKEVSERFLSSATISSNIPRWNKTQTEEGHEAGGRFVRTSMRVSLPANEHKQTGNPSPMQRSTNSSDSMSGGTLAGESQTLAELPRNAGVPFNLNVPGLVSIYKGSVQSSETFKNNLQGTAARVISPPVFSGVSLAIGQRPLSQNNKETPVSDVKLRNSVIAQRSLLNRRIDEEVMCSTVSEFRHNTPSSANGISHMVYVTQPGNGLTRIGFLSHSNLRVSNNSTLHKSAYQRNTGQQLLPALERLSTGIRSENKNSEERLSRCLEVSCERDHQKALWRRNEECGDPFPNNRPSGRTLKPELFHSESVYKGYNAQVRSPESYPVTTPFESMTACLQQLQRLMPTCKPSTGDSYKIELVQNETFQRGEIPRKDMLISSGLSPPIRTREASNRLSAWQGENDKKRSHRSKSLSPSMISNVESGNFGSLESIRRYYKSLGNYKSLGTTEMSLCLRIGSAAKQVDGCPDLQLQFIESKAHRRPDEMPIDLSNRKREQSATERTANSTTVTTPRNIDCCERGNAEISGGYMSQSRHARSPTPGTIPVTPQGVPSERNWVDVSGNLLQVPSSPLISQPSSRLSSPASMPDSHLPPKKRRIPSYLSSLDDSSTSPKEGLNVSTSPDVVRSPGCYHIPMSNEESLEIETKAQLEVKTDLPDRGVHHGQWQERNCLENLEDVRWAITPDEDGDLPLHIGVARGSESYVRKCVGIMSRLGASLDVYDSNRKTALQLAVITSQANMVEILLNASASPNVLDRNGANSVHLAVKYGELECLKCLLTRSKHALDLDARNYEGLTALHISVISNQLEATRILLRVGASVNITDGKTGQTPLHYAAERNIQQMAKLLLVFGANPSTASYSGCTPVQLASAKSHLEMAKMLERGAFVLSSGAVATRKNLHVKEQ